MVREHGPEHPSQWAAIAAIAPKLGCTTETLRRWVRCACAFLLHSTIRACRNSGNVSANLHQECTMSAAIDRRRFLVNVVDYKAG
jgi:transposase-like protein